MPGTLTLERVVQTFIAWLETNSIRHDGVSITIRVPDMPRAADLDAVVARELAATLLLGEVSPPPITTIRVHGLGVNFNYPTYQTRLGV